MRHLLQAIAYLQAIHFNMHAIPKKEFRNAFQFLAGYFHQDFSVEFGEPELAVAKFVEEATPDRCVCVKNELLEILSQYFEDELENVIFQLGCYYDPQKHRGISMSEWLKSVIVQIDGLLSSNG